ncbi:MAG TPA: hypothetical protein VLE97_06390 [Gaiellaceae bacterium]|nr:hypothetical protein [Gaiellaceae bacterium]
MTAPIDIECPRCKSTAGNYCTSEAVNPAFRQTLSFHHAERVDEALRAETRRQHDPRALRQHLREALDRLSSRQPTNDDLSFIMTAREVFGL